MVIVGIELTEIKAKKKKIAKGSIRVNNNINIVKVERAGKDKELVRMSFNATTKYEPEVGEIVINGALLWLPTEKTDIVKEWKEKKKLPKQVAEEALNGIINRVTIEALILAKDVGLPSPIKLPRLKIEG